MILEVKVDGPKFDYLEVNGRCHESGYRKRAENKRQWKIRTWGISQFDHRQKIRKVKLILLI